MISMEHAIEGWREAHDALMENPCPVTLDEIATVLERTDSDTSHGDEVTYTDMADAVLALLSGSDPAVYVVRESDIAAVEVERVDAQWNADGALMAWTGESAEEVRGQNATALRNLAHREAVARAIEAEQAVDPVEAKAIELHQVAYGGRIGFGHATLNAQEMFRSLARYVLGQEADHA